MLQNEYSYFLTTDHATETLWLKLDDAIKLGAGYRPACDDNQQLLPNLKALHNRMVANQRNLIAALNKNSCGRVPPTVKEVKGIRLVEAREFLSWLSQYFRDSGADIPFPIELARTVGTLPLPATGISTVEFTSLVLCLEGYFELDFENLSSAQQERVKTDLALFSWNNYKPEQRRKAAMNFDYWRDPAMEEKRRIFWNHILNEEELKEQILKWERLTADSPSDLALQEQKINQLRSELASHRETLLQSNGIQTGSPEWRRDLARRAADARHDASGGSRDKQKRMREIWATGKYSSRERCAEEECAALGMSFSSARKALRNTPGPARRT